MPCATRGVQSFLTFIDDNIDMGLFILCSVISVLILAYMIYDISEEFLTEVEDLFQRKILISAVKLHLRFFDIFSVRTA